MNGIKQSKVGLFRFFHTSQELEKPNFSKRSLASKSWAFKRF